MIDPEIEPMLKLPVDKDRAEEDKMKISKNTGGRKMLGKFVTVKLKGRIDPRQGAVINENPLIIRGVSGREYECEGEPVLVSNPPPSCLGCNLPLGKLCVKCEEQIKMLDKTLAKNGLSFTQIDTKQKGGQLMTPEEAYTKIAKIAREHALIHQAAGGVIVIVHPDVQKEEGLFEQIQWMHGLGPHPENMEDNQ